MATVSAVSVVSAVSGQQTMSSCNGVNGVPSQSGYDRDKFIEGKDELDEFLCAICQGIFREPKVTQCCGQTYCHKDISQWLESHNSCPNCRKRLTVAALIEPPKALKNLWSKLKMRCDYSEQGCDQSVSLEDMSVHLAQCDYRPNAECKTCGIVRTSVKEHNCVESLKRVNTALRLKQVRDAQAFERKLNKVQIALNDKFKKELEELKLEIGKEMDDHDKYVKRKFSAFQKRWDSPEAGSSKAKRSLVDYGESSRPKKRGHLRFDSDASSDSSADSTQDQTSSEGSGSEPEQEDSEQEMTDSDSQ